MAGKAESFVYAEELCFDEGRGVITAGGNKMKVSGWHTEVAVVAFLRGYMFAWLNSELLHYASNFLRSFAVSEFRTLPIVTALVCFVSACHEEGALGKKKTKWHSKRPHLLPLDSSSCDTTARMRTRAQRDVLHNTNVRCVCVSVSSVGRPAGGAGGRARQRVAGVAEAARHHGFDPRVTRFDRIGRGSVDRERRRRRGKGGRGRR